MHKNELVRALEEVLSDDSFKVNAPPTIERKSTLNEFTQKLSASLKGIITASMTMTKSFSYNNDRIWRNFFLLCSSEFVNQ